MKNLKIVYLILFTGHLTGSIYRFSRGDLVVGLALLGASLAFGAICWQKYFTYPKFLLGRKILGAVRYSGLFIATISLLVYIYGLVKK